MGESKKAKQERRASLRPHPVRDQILDVMRSYDQPISPGRLARITGNTLGSTAYHVRTLVSAGVIELADEARVRGAVEHFYAIVPGGQDEARLTDPIVQMLGLCGALTVPDPAGGYPRPSIIDELAREQLNTLLGKVRPEVMAIVAAATARARA